MTIEYNKKKYRIPDKEIEKNMKNLQLTKEEAIQVWLEDNGIIDNDKQLELEKKAKDNKITQTIHKASSIDKTQKKTQKERVKKENPTKERIIAAIAELLPTLQAENVQITNVSKYITFMLEGKPYTINLICNTKQLKNMKNGGGEG